MGAHAYLKIGIEQIGPLLASNIAEWNLYKYSIPYKVELVIEGQDFQNLNLEAPDLNLVCFRDCSFKNCLINRSNMDYTLFDGCYFYETSITKCSINDSKFVKCFFQDCNFSLSTLRNAEFYSTNLKQVIGTGTEFLGAYLLDSPLPVWAKLDRMERELIECNNSLINKDPEDDKLQ